MNRYDWLNAEEIATREKHLSVNQVRRGWRNGTLPCIATSEKGNNRRCPVVIWEKFMRGEPLPDRYFLENPGQDKSSV